MADEKSANDQTNASARDDETDVSRREMLKATAGALLAVPLLNADGMATALQTKAPLFFTPAEFALVDELTEIIIPADEHSPGARAARAAEYIDYRLSESFTDEPKKRWREGLKLVDEISQQMHGKTFMQAAPEERIAVVSRIAGNEENPQKPEEKFFVELKRRTAHAYYTSKIGIHTELEYKGNTYLKEFVGEDAKK
ncbi:MAG TPA: gluconate 2-dehydrogenase subunit 3 family protein [Blastocatellia bacterium]|nr:gluconate 2-dehydrogenase subunit 3 family protein [Blastocatellia bacterium]